MMIKDEQGKEIEVFTSAELAEKTEALEADKTANPDKAAELADLTAKYEQAQKDLDAAAGGNEEQIKRLRTERDEAKAKASSATVDLDKKLNEFRKEIVGDTEKDLLDRLSGGDAKLRDKIKLEFDNYAPTKTTKRDIEERMAKAYQLVTNTLPKPSLTDNLGFAAGRGDGGGYRPSEKVEVTANQKAIGDALGITDEDRKNAEKLKSMKK